MSKITDYGLLAAPLSDDLLLAVDIHDTSMSSAGSTKKVTIGSVATGSLAPSGDTSGVTDTANIAAQLGALPAAGGNITLGSGAFTISGSAALTLARAGTVITGAGMTATTLNIAASFTGAALFSVDADNCTIAGMTIQGASTTITSNPQCLGIQVRARNVNLPNLRMFYINGYACKIINQTPAGAHQVNHQPHIHNWFMEKCAGGIWLNGDAGDTMGAIISDIHGNSIGGGTAANLDALRLEDVFDVDITNWCGSVGSATSGHSIHLAGHCATVRITGGDIGGFPVPATSSGQCAVKIEDGTGTHSSQIRFMNLALQTHDVGVSIPGAAADIRFTSCDITDNNRDGVQLAGTGVDIFFRGCKFTNNGAAPPAATNVYDVNWTGTSHGQFSDCVFNSSIVAQGSAGVQNSANTTRNRIQFFPNATFGGSGSSSANWFPANQFPRYVRVIGSSPGLTPRQPSLTVASGTVVTNDTGFDCQVYVSGGTVSAVAIGGTAVTGITATPFNVRVPANQTITLTYTVVPTAFQWFGD